MTDDIEIKEGKIFGGWRAPENLVRSSTTSIHDDGVAKSVGMRGGTIQGTIHLSMFAPLAQIIFGDRWFEQGTVSMYYTIATVDKKLIDPKAKAASGGIINWPYRPDSYILISAGADGLYGTGDDITNFGN